MLQDGVVLRCPFRTRQSRQHGSGQEKGLLREGSRGPKQVQLLGGVLSPIHKRAWGHGTRGEKPDGSRMLKGRLQRSRMAGFKLLKKAVRFPWSNE